MRLLSLMIVLLVLSVSVSFGAQGDLSDAMEESASDTKNESRPGREWENLFEDEPELRNRDDAEESSAADGDDWWGWQLATDFGYLVPFDGDVEGISRVSITPFIYEDERYVGGVFVGFGSFEFEDGSLLDEGVKRAYTWEIGVSGRRYFNDSHVFLSPYIAGQISWQSLSWEYRNAVQSGSDEIESDNLNGVGAYVGAGLAVARGKRVSLFGEAGIGGVLYGNTTDEGFHDDIFDHFAYVAVKAGLTIRF